MRSYVYIIYSTLLFKSLYVISSSNLCPRKAGIIYGTLAHNTHEVSKMMKTNRSKLFFQILIILIIAAGFSGCGKNAQNKQSQPQAQQAGTGQEGDKAPDQLKEMEESIEAIIAALKGPAVGVKEEEKKGQGGQDGQKQQGSQTQQENTQGGQDKQGGQGGQENKKQDGPGQSQGQGGQGGQQQNQQPPKQESPWEKISPVISKLHYTWNDYMTQAVKAGATRALVDNFDMALNNLTKSIISNNETNTLMDANKLYSFIPDFYNLYRTKTSPEIKRIRYFTRDAMLYSKTGNWEQAEANLTSLKASWSLYKNTVPKEQQDLANRLDFAISQLETVVKEKNQPLTDIKGRVALSDIEALEKAVEEQAEKGGSQSSGGGSS